MEDGLTPAVWCAQDENAVGDEGDYSDVRKRLFHEETPGLSNKRRPVVVYLRVRPKSPLEVTNKDQDCLHRIGDSEILAVAPRFSQTFKNRAGARCPAAEGNQKFTFTRIFDPPSSQKDIFDECLLPTLQDFFEGQNCLVFTYGITNSGKTYTVTGTPSEPGILPRSLDVIFNSVEQHHFSSVALKPKNHSDVLLLSKEDEEREREKKVELVKKAREMSMASSLPGADETTIVDAGEAEISTLSKASSNYSKITDDGTSLCEQVHDDSSIELASPSNVQFSIWVSFAEIYNELIYDLLAEQPLKIKARPTLRLAEDKNRNHFIKGLLEVKVDSVEEAMLLLQLGQQQRHVAATRLNYRSSRSHSVYTIKLIKVVNTERPTIAMVNRVSIVDLAGAERSGKTGASGVRMKEAGNINNSLLTLGKCIDALKYNQSSRRCGDERVVPFRDSKLTRLFQNYFVGKGKAMRQGKIAMIVNVSNCASVFDETIHVLKFSALASKIVPIVKPGLTAACIPVLTLPPLTVPPGDDVAETIWGKEEEEGEEEKAEVEDIAPTPIVGPSCARCKVLEHQMCQYREEARARNSELQCQLIELECKVRQEVAREFNEQLSEIEDKHSRELEEQAEDLEGMYQQRMQLIQKSTKKHYSRKRRCPDYDEPSKPRDDGRTELDLANAEMIREVNVEREILEQRIGELICEKAAEEKRVEELMQVASQTRILQEAHSKHAVSETRKLQEAHMRAISELKAAHHSETKNLQEAHLRAISELEAASHSETRNVQEAHLNQTESETRKLQEAHLRAISELEAAHHSELSTARADVESSAARLSAREEELSWLEEGKVAREVELADLHQRLAALQDEKDSVDQDLRFTTERVRALEAELAGLSSANASLEEARCDLELKLSRTVAAKDALATRVEDSRHALTQREVELLQTSDQRVEEMRQAASETAKLHLRAISELEAAHHSETNNLQEAHLRAISELEAAHHSETGKLQEAHLNQDESEMRKLQEAHLRAISELEAAHHSELSTARADVESSAARLSAQEEELSWLEEGKVARESELADLRQRLAALQDEKDSLDQDLRSTTATVTRTLSDYESTLQSQVERIRALEAELEGLSSANASLEEARCDLEFKLSRTVAAKDALATRVDDLTESVEDSRRTLTQREVELLESSDQCRSLLEDQVAELRKLVASLQHDLCTAREDTRCTQQQFREKEAELLALARSSSDERTAVRSLTSELEELRRKADGVAQEHQANVEKMQGHHQLELAQLRIRVRELSDQVAVREEEVEEKCQEVEQAMADHAKAEARLKEDVEAANRRAEKKASKLTSVEQEVKAFKKDISSTRKKFSGEKEELQHKVESKNVQISELESELKGSQQELLEQKMSGERELQGVKEDWRKEVAELQRQLSQGPTPLDDCSEEHIYEEPPELLPQPTEPSDHSLSLLQSIENTISTRPPDMDRSKPFVPLLERSSQLIEDSFDDFEEERIQLTVVPSPTPGKKCKVVKTKATPAAPKSTRKGKKRSIAEAGKAEVSPAPKKSKYPLRSRKQPQWFKTDEELENLPLEKKSTLKKITQYLGTRSTSKGKPSECDEMPPPSTEGRPRRTRKAVLRKSLISGPLELMDSPMSVRPSLEARTSINLGTHLRPPRRGN